MKVKTRLEPFHGKTVSLIDLCETITDCPHSTPKWTEKGKLVIRNFNIKKGRLLLDNPSFTNEEAFNKRIARSKPEPGDLIITREAPMGEVCIIPNGIECCLGQRMVLIKPSKKKVKSNYLLYALQSEFVQKQIQKSDKTGSIVSNLRIPVLKGLQIPVFNSDNESQIGEILGQIDAKIHLNNRINAELEAMAKLLYDYWFVQFDFPFDFAQGKPNAHGKPYKSSGGKMVYNERLKREIPEGWEVKKLKTFVNNYDSKRIPLSKQQREKKKGIYPYYGATSVMDYIDDYIFDGDYILVAEDGSVMDEKGFPIVQFIYGKTWVNNHAHVLNAKDNFNNEYLYQLVKNISVIQIMTGSIQKKITKENLLNVAIIMPPNSLLEIYGSCAIPIRREMINRQKQNQQLTELRDWLLPMLMNGQVKVR